MTERDTLELANRGRRIVTVIISTQLFLSLAVILLAVAFGRFEAAGRRVIKLLCEVGLMRSLWKGNRWAKWFYVAGFALGAAGMVFLAQRAPRMFPPTVVTPVAVVFAFVAHVVGFSRSVNAFFAYQRGEAVAAEIAAALASAHAGTRPEFDEDSAAGSGGSSAHATMTVYERACESCGAEVPAQIDWCPRCGMTYEAAEA